jgi:tellurite resistance protein TerC
MDLNHIIAWALFLVFVLVMLGIDLFVLHRKPHAISLREAAIGSLIPVVGAVLFAGAIYWAYNSHFLDLGVLSAEQRAQSTANLFPETGHHATLLFMTGYVVELSLSADNVFLFVILINFFKVPRELQHRVLFWGVLGALLMRGIMIILGAAILSRFHWFIYLFGAFLLFTSIRMLTSRSDSPDPSNNIAVKIARKLFPIHNNYVGKNFFTRIDGRRVATTLFLVLVCIEFTDLVFALDSIPAIFGITQDAFIVFTSNVFAILGLRSMYFLLAGVMDKFHYLKFGLAVVLGFVGVKMLLPGLGHLYGRFITQGEHHWDVDQTLSLMIILGSLAASVVASLIFPKKLHAQNPLVQD